MTMHDWLDALAEDAKEVNALPTLRDVLSTVYAAAPRLQRAVLYAAHGALGDRGPESWPGLTRLDDVRSSLNMSVLPVEGAMPTKPGTTTAKDAALRQALLALEATLGAVERAALAAWLAATAAQDPDRLA